MPTLDSSQDELLARLLTDLTDQRRRGLRPDVEAFARQYPDIGEELRQLWAAAQFADELGRSSHDLNDATPGTPQGQSPLPRPFGDYDLREEVGRGGMGIVYKAWDRTLQRMVALKMVLRAELASPAELERFRAEARLAAGLEHEHIVPVYAVGEHEGQAFFTMQFVEGTTLARRLAAGPLPAREAAECLLAICGAVHQAHQQGLLHRDLKPSNILLDREGRPLVTDFGLAKRVEGGGSLTRSGAIVGTPSYMSPEQAAGSRGRLAPASDVYSLGAILYEMLTGRPPFQAATALDTLLLVLNQDAVPPRLLNPQVDRDLELICLKCLQKPADLRYTSAAALADDLRAYLDGQPIAARSNSLGSFVSRLFRETPHAAVLENWGLLWMWHSLMVLLLCVVTNVMLWAGIGSHLPYILLWSFGLVAWGAIFWTLRRRGGPVMEVERQIAHAWAAGVAASIGVLLVEVLLEARGVGLRVLDLSPLLAVGGGCVFLFKAGLLSGTFYLAAAAMFLAAIPMALFPEIGPLLFGIVSALCFFLPGLKYHRQRLRTAHKAD